MVSQKRDKQLHDQLRQDVLSDPEARSEYEAFKLQLELAQEMKAARQKADLTQEKVASRMSTQKPLVARLEAAGGRGKHSPSLKTLVRYANAIGYELHFKLKPRNDRGGKKLK